MTKITTFTIGVVLGAGVATLIITQLRSDSGRIRDDMEPAQEQHDRLSDLAAEHAPLSNLVAQSTRLEASSNEPAREVLRLRGEVGRLHRDLESLRQESKEEIDTLGRQNRQQVGFSLVERYGANGIDTNSVPNIEVHSSRNDVSAELRRVGANVLNEEEDYIQAEISPAMVASTDNRLLAITMQFWFKDGRLNSRKDWPKWQRAANRQ